MTESEQRQQLLQHAQQLNSSGLSVGKSGNISLRCPQGLLITPSGVAYDQLQPQDLVKIDYQGQPIGSNSYPPSSEWHFHLSISNTPNITLSSTPTPATAPH